jgi:hypothetical protein
MGTLEERIAYLEGKVDEHSKAFVATRDAIASLERRMDGRFDAIDRRFSALDGRVAAIDGRFDGLDRRVDRLEDRMARRFVWVVGIQITTFIALLGAMLSRG